MLEKFEKKVIEIKNRIGRKNTGIILFSLVCIIVLFSMILLKNFKIEKQEVQDSYNRAMYDFVSDINNIENEMTKLKITSNDTYTLTTLASVFAKANSAKSNLDILPFSAQSISNVSKFLSQLSDFSYSLMRNILNGDNISEYKDNIDSLYEKISELANVVDKIYTDLTANNIRWDELEKAGDEQIKDSNAEEEVSSVNYIGKTFTEYEGIIYDGAFSNHILTTNPALLSGNILSIEQAQEKIKEKLDVESIEFKSEQDGRIPLYVYEVKLKESNTLKTIYITKEDGIIYQMISDRNVTNEYIDIAQAEQKAIEYINKVGIYDIVPTYYLKSDNMVTISFAAVQEDVVVYSDLIKVKVALDNGEIMTYEANGYVYNHKERDITATKTIDEARDVLYKDLEIENERLCIIPTDSKDEVLVYEFEGVIDDNRFLVYVNANTLVEEKIYILLETEGGTLAM